MKKPTKKAIQQFITNAEIKDPIAAEQLTKIKGGLIGVFIIGALQP